MFNSTAITERQFYTASLTQNFACKLLHRVSRTERVDYFMHRAYALSFIQLYAQNFVCQLLHHRTLCVNHLRQLEHYFKLCSDQTKAVYFILDLFNEFRSFLLSIILSLGVKRPFSTKCFSQSWSWYQSVLYINQSQHMSHCAHVFSAFQSCFDGLSCFLSLAVIFSS